MGNLENNINNFNMKIRSQNDYFNNKKLEDTTFYKKIDGPSMPISKKKETENEQKEEEKNSEKTIENKIDNEKGTESKKKFNSSVDINFQKLFKFNRISKRSKTINDIIPNNKLLTMKKEMNFNSIIEYSKESEYELNFIRNGDEIRNSYICKLISKKILTNEKEKSHNSIIIFDWDDTLLPTSFLSKNGVYDENKILTEKEKEKILELGNIVLNLLEISIEKGDTYIITNAGKGWVEFSCEKYYPKVINILKKIKIISARENYENKYPTDSKMWKFSSFLDVQKNLDSNLVTNIICLGDSFIEIQAGMKLASQFNQAFIKTVKFREMPKLDELIKQLKLVSTQFNTIYSSVKNLTIKVEKKNKK